MITQNPNRYKPDTDGVRIEAGGPPPLRIRLAQKPELTPTLKAEGIIVRVGDTLLAGPETARAVAESGVDPHLAVGANDTITLRSGATAVMGRTIPVITVDITGLAESAAAEGFGLRRAGVLDAEWSFEGPGNPPVEILNQINWTLAGVDRPTDRWTRAELSLGADYSYDTLKIAPPGESGRIDYEAIAEVVRRVGARLVELRKDFNLIGDIYFDGVIPTGSALIRQESQLDRLPPDTQDAGRQRIRKETRVAAVDPGPTERRNSGADIVSAVAGATVDLNDVSDLAVDPATAGRERNIVDRATDFATGVVNAALKVPTPLGLLVRGIRRLFGRR
jgi:hypothetical protein